MADTCWLHNVCCRAHLVASLCHPMPSRMDIFIAPLDLQLLGPSKSQICTCLQTKAVTCPFCRETVSALPHCLQESDEHSAKLCVHQSKAPILRGSHSEDAASCRCQFRAQIGLFDVSVTCKLMLTGVCALTCLLFSLACMRNAAIGCCSS